jgi:Resolvase, N terminal domain
LPDHYADGGISGGTLERPALRRLLCDVEAGLIDVVVVYKVDRLSRSLTDFAKLVDVFDAENISKSYVSRILRLALLAPDIVDCILDRGPTAGLEQFLEPFPAEWERQ